jgi:hypothetical protein
LVIIIMMRQYRVIALSAEAPVKSLRAASAFHLTAGLLASVCVILPYAPKIKHGPAVARSPGGY